ncbi:DNA polymerase II small subunit [uncultured archaeon]|nr:DNA polymerase II small subunit [uncultured archaeon]
MSDALRQKGIRISLDAEPMLQNAGTNLIEELVSLGKPFISRQDVEDAITRLGAAKVEVVRSRERSPAAEHPSNVKVMHQLDVTGKSRTTGSSDDFVAYFRNRYQRMSKLLSAPSKYATTNLSDIKREINENVRAIVLVYDKRDTKQGSILLEIEDMHGQFKAVISRKNEQLYEKARHILKDDMISITGKVLEPFIIVEDVEWPDMPIGRDRKTSENDLACAYISDIHFGSRHFLEKQFERFINWLNLKGNETELAGKVKYLVVAGDVVDGVGIYPNQEKDLTIKDVYKQYELFDNFVEMLPDYIDVIVAPGNHDAVRRAEPMPALDDTLVKTDVIKIGNPSTVLIEGIRHVIYHGTSMDSMIASVPGLSYNTPEKVSREYLRRRHLSPIYGGNLIVPERIDYLLIEDEPDVLHCGHVHKNGYMQYRGTHLINTGTFQDRTDFQVKQGHVPTPGVVGILEMKTSNYKTVDFNGE